MTKKSRYKKAADTLTQLLNEPGDYDEKVMKELDASPTTTDPENVSQKRSFEGMKKSYTDIKPLGQSYRDRDIKEQFITDVKNLTDITQQKSFADTCLERAEKATLGPWNNRPGYSKYDTPAIETKAGGQLAYTTHYGLMEQDAEFIAHARTDVPELAKRLQRACEMLKQPKRNMDMLILADELETPPEGEK